MEEGLSTLGRKKGAVLKGCCVLLQLPASAAGSYWDSKSLLRCAGGAVPCQGAKPIWVNIIREVLGLSEMLRWHQQRDGGTIRKEAAPSQGRWHS